MNIFYIVALSIGSIFWFAVTVWIIMGYLPKIKALPEKSRVAYQPIKKIIKDNSKVKAQKVSQAASLQQEELSES